MIDSSRQEAAPARRVDPAIAEAVERQTRTMDDQFRHAPWAAGRYLYAPTAALV
ncbi:hypothetical protein SAMN05216268_109216 [Streptomyces yunnanensis]|uniref:Uncharacterized protein n=1 Tax=Streptomyces yunnanensis TaxID=156453 RepID=A0A9X8MXZ0_9ACTN|nr:hypothetical protein SAMN05216268_109216 [Streptomyces yunnanensis]